MVGVIFTTIGGIFCVTRTDLRFATDAFLDPTGRDVQAMRGHEISVAFSRYWCRAARRKCAFTIMRELLASVQAARIRHHSTAEFAEGLKTGPAVLKKKLGAYVGLDFDGRHPVTSKLAGELHSQC